MTDVDDPEVVLEDFPPPRQGGRWWKVLLALAVVVVLVVGATGLWAYRQVNPSGRPGNKVTFDIPPGSSTRHIGALLDEKGVITNHRVWDLYVKVTGAGPWQAGRYTFREHSSMGAAIDVLDAAPEVTVERLTIPEGYTLAQIAARVGKLKGRSAEKFLALAQSGQVRSQFEPPGSNNLEGLLFPDTYVIDEKEDEAAILKRLVGAFDSQATEIGLPDAAARVGVTPYQAVIVASMIEREARLDEERPKVARVVYNRLKQGIRLGIDATTRYELNKPSAPLRKSELERDSPYNTRTRAGLPPTPIAAPGRAALEAALDPADGPWIYYVIADKDGHHAFVTTDAEFQRAKAEAKSKGLL